MSGVEDRAPCASPDEPRVERATAKSGRQLFAIDGIDGRVDCVRRRADRGRPCDRRRLNTDLVRINAPLGGVRAHEGSWLAVRPERRRAVTMRPPARRTALHDAERTPAVMPRRGDHSPDLRPRDRSRECCSRPGRPTAAPVLELLQRIHGDRGRRNVADVCRSLPATYLAGSTLATVSGPGK